MKQTQKITKFPKDENMNDEIEFRFSNKNHSPQKTFPQIENEKYYISLSNEFKFSIKIIYSFSYKNNYLEEKEKNLSFLDKKIIKDFILNNKSDKIKTFIKLKLTEVKEKIYELNYNNNSTIDEKVFNKNIIFINDNIEKFNYSRNNINKKNSKIKLDKTNQDLIDITSKNEKSLDEIIEVKNKLISQELNLFLINQNLKNISNELDEKQKEIIVYNTKNKNLIVNFYTDILGENNDLVTKLNFFFKLTKFNFVLNYKNPSKKYSLKKFKNYENNYGMKNYFIFRKIKKYHYRLLLRF